MKFEVGRQYKTIRPSDSGFSLDGTCIHRTAKTTTIIFGIRSDGNASTGRMRINIDENGNEFVKTIHPAKTFFFANQEK